MTKEQRKAIEICKEKIIEPFYDFPNPTSIEIKDTDVRVIDIVLSLIKEQQEEIEGLKDKEVLIKRYFNKCDLIKQKDKQIDLMANSILAREIGKNSCQFNKTCTKFEKGRDIHCKDCIKQYFENKVNSEKEK